MTRQKMSLVQVPWVLMGFLITLFAKDAKGDTLSDPVSIDNALKVILRKDIPKAYIYDQTGNPFSDQGGSLVKRVQIRMDYPVNIVLFHALVDRLGKIIDQKDAKPLMSMAMAGGLPYLVLPTYNESNCIAISIIWVRIWQVVIYQGRMEMSKRGSILVLDRQHVIIVEDKMIWVIVWKILYYNYTERMEDVRNTLKRYWPGPSKGDENSVGGQ